MRWTPASKNILKLPRGIVVLLSSVLLASVLSGCGDDSSCAPREEEHIVSPDGRYVVQQWVSICGSPGATVADVVSVADKNTASPPWHETFVFFEQQGSTERNQVSASWLDGGRLTITVNVVGKIRNSPNEMGGAAIIYRLGPGVDLSALEAHKEGKIHERDQLERLKTSRTWHYVEASYDYDAYVIKSDQAFLDWARENTARQR